MYLKKITTHLRVKYSIKPQECMRVAEAIQQWDNIIQEPHAIQIPRMLQNPIPGVELHTNGI